MSAGSTSIYIAGDGPAEMPGLLARSTLV